MSKTLVKAPPPNLNPLEVAEHFARCGWFQDATDISKAVVKILAGQEMGIGPMAAMQGINIIKGKPTLSANLLATQVKRHPVYDYKIVKHEDAGCALEFFQNGESIGVSAFTAEDAKKAGLTSNPTWTKYPKAMVFARALSQGVRWYCPDVTAGSPAYVPEELGAEVDGDGEVVTPDGVEDPPSLPPPSSEKDLKDLDWALNRGSVSEQNRQMIVAWGSLHLPREVCSRALTALKDEGDEEKRTATIDWLIKSAGEWAAKQTDLEPDTEGLPT